MSAHIVGGGFSAVEVSVDQDEVGPCFRQSQSGGPAHALGGT